VEVTGKAARPGVYSFPQPPSLREVWAKAGAEGTPPDPDKTILSGSRVEVKPDGGYAVSAMSGAQLVTLGLPIDLNRASVEDLDAIPGLGPALAQRIVDYRQAHGPFMKIEDLREVSGVGPENLAKLKPYLGLGGPEANAPPDWKAPAATGNSVSGTYIDRQEGRLPESKSGLGPKTLAGVIDLNLASQAELETLPGIGPVIAQRIIDYRRAHGPYKTIADLRKVSGIGRKKLEKLRPYVAITPPGPPASGR
jgi:competence protein ComEA